MKRFKNRLATKAELHRKHKARAKAQTISNIEQQSLNQVNANLKLRYVGLVLVQGSSGLALLGYSMMTYWVALWLGLLCYQVTALSFFKEDNRVYKLTKIKYQNNLGSSLDTVNALHSKRKREIVYIIGNTMGLILIGMNILLS
tara:strand:+ start:276 stop:707 length:432 start_codon:yes stop_codon:yes gene_type:complete